MGRRRRNPKATPAAKAIHNAVKPVEQDSRSTPFEGRPAADLADDAFSAEPQSHAGSSTGPSEAAGVPIAAAKPVKTEGLELSVELQREIENFTNNFHVQRVSGTPPARVEVSTSATRETPPGSGAPAPRPAAQAADRRANPRYAFNATAEVTATDSGAKRRTRVRDLSQQGCYLDTENPLPLGASANLCMTKGAKALEVQGRVVYVQPGKGMGLMFTAVQPEHGGTLDAWINESRETSWLANNRRRSQRVVIKIPVRVSVQVGATVLAEEETYTLAVSAHGALLVVSAPLYRGQRLTLSNPQTKDSLECLVAHIDRFPNEPVKAGVEFLLPNPTFWHVAFPPKDWTPRHPDAKSGHRP
jgi:PilZ domain